MSASAQLQAGSYKLPERIHSNDMVIGLALGSPREQPLPPTPQEDLRYFQGFENASLEPGPLRPLRNERVVKPSKQRPQKWRGLGGLFGKRTPSNDEQNQPIYALERPLFAEESLSKPAPRSPEDLSVPTLRPWVQKEPENHYTAHATGPGQPVGEPGLLRRASSRRKGLRKRNLEEARMTRPRAMTAPSASEIREPHLPARVEERRTQARPKPSTNLLQVEIPNVEMERYSVMFRDLLNPHQVKTLPPIRDDEPQVFSREAIASKAAGQKSLPVTDAARSKPSRDSGSSTSSRTPSFSLFPSQAPVQGRTAKSKPLPRPSPLGRSVTAPDVTVSPARPVITASKSYEYKELMILLHQQHQREIPNADSIRHADGRTSKTSHGRHFSSTERSRSISSAGSNTAIDSQTTSISSIRDLPLLPPISHQQDWSIRLEPEEGSALHHYQARPGTATQGLSSSHSHAEGFPTRSSSLRSLGRAEKAQRPRQKSQSPKRRNPNSNSARRRSPPPTPPPKNSPAMFHPAALPPLPALPLPPPIHTPSADRTHRNGTEQSGGGSDSKTSSVTSLAGRSGSGSEAEGHVVEIARQVSLSRREKKEVVVPTTPSPVAEGRTSATAPVQEQLRGQGQRQQKKKSPPPRAAKRTPRKASSNANTTPTKTLTPESYSPQQGSPGGQPIGLGLGGIGLDLLPLPAVPQLQVNGIGGGGGDGYGNVQPHPVDAARRVQMVRGWQERTSRLDGQDLGLAGRKSEYVYVEEG